jgi:hypothetical protein
MNFADAKTTLADFIGGNAVRFNDSTRGLLINLARRELSRLHDLRFNEVSDTFVTVAGTRGYALPTGWSRPHTLWYVHPENAGTVTLDYQSKEAFDLLFPDATQTALPTHYTVWAGQLQLGKTPDRVVTINRNFYRILADLTGTQIDDLMDQAWEVVHFKALVEASRYLVEDPRALTWKEKATELENQLVIEHARGRSAGRRAESQEPG